MIILIAICVVLVLASDPHTAEWRVGRWSRFSYEPRSRRVRSFGALGRSRGGGHS